MKAFEAEDTITGARYVFVLHGDRVTMHDACTGAVSRSFPDTDSAFATPFPFGCETAAEYFDTQVAYSLRCEHGIGFVGWVEPGPYVSQPPPDAPSVAEDLLFA